MSQAPTDRRIGPLLATALVAGNIIGSGVFLLPATLGAIGSISVVGWVLATLGAFITTAVFATLGRVCSTPDGLVGYVRQGLGRFPAFGTGLFYWMGTLTGCVAIAVAAAGYFVVFTPGLANPLGLAAVTIGAIWIFTAVNLAGAQATTRFSAVSLAAGLVPILAIAVFGWLRFDPAVFAHAWNVSGQPAGQAVRASMVSVFWAYTGFESAAVATAVVRDPARNVAIATYGGTAVAAVVYLAASVAIMGLIPAQELAVSTAPFALAVGRFVGPGAAAVVAACALVKTCGTLNGWLLLLAQSARAGLHSAGAASADDVPDRAPRRLLVIMGLVMSALVLASVSPTLGRQFALIINVSTVWCVVAYAACAAALWSLAHRLADRGARLAARGAGGVALAFSLWLISTGEASTLWLTAGLAAVTAVLWLGARQRAAIALP